MHHFISHYSRRQGSQFFESCFTSNNIDWPWPEESYKHFIFCNSYEITNNISFYRVASEECKETYANTDAKTKSKEFRNYKQTITNAGETIDTYRMKYEDKLSKMYGRKSMLTKIFGDDDNWRVRVIDQGIKDLEMEKAQLGDRYNRLFDNRVKRSPFFIEDQDGMWFLL